MGTITLVWSIGGGSDEGNPTRHGAGMIGKVMSAPRPALYRIRRWLAGAGLAFYFTRIERFHSERVPITGPVLSLAKTKGG